MTQAQTMQDLDDLLCRVRLGSVDAHADILEMFRATTAAAQTVAPDFDLAATALGFCRLPNGKWFSPTPSPSMSTAGTFETAEDIFKWWGKASGNAPTECYHCKGRCFEPGPGESVPCIRCHGSGFAPSSVPRPERVTEASAIPPADGGHAA